MKWVVAENLGRRRSASNDVIQDYLQRNDDVDLRRLSGVRRYCVAFDVGWVCIVRMVQ